MKSAEEILKEHIAPESWFGRDNSPIRQEICKLMEQYADQFKPKWISISDIDKHPEMEGISVLLWQENLSDPDYSRFQRGVFYLSDGTTPPFIVIYPNASQYFERQNDYINYDLEGDKCQITHFQIIEKPEA